MATIVRYRETGAHYLLLSGGYAAYRSRVPSPILGNLVPQDDSDEYRVALLCDAAGRTGWVRSQNIEVVEVDGQPPGEILAEFEAEQGAPSESPAGLE